MTAVEDTARLPRHYPSYWTVLWLIDGLDWPIRDAAATLRGPAGTSTAKHADTLEAFALSAERRRVPESTAIISLRVLYDAHDAAGVPRPWPPPMPA